MTKAVLNTVRALVVSALCGLMWDLGDVRSAPRKSGRRERRQAMRAQQTRPSTQHTALPDSAER